jgi:hypothetical protein
MGNELIGEILMQKNICQLEAKVGEKVFHLLCEQDSPLAYVKEALFQYLKYVGQLEDNAKKLEEENKASIEDKPSENEEICL